MIQALCSQSPEELHRYPIWFGVRGFNGHTDEKARTLQVLERLMLQMKRYVPGMFSRPDKPMVFFDMGSGDGRVSAGTNELMHELHPGGSQPCAADKLQECAESTLHRLDWSQDRNLGCAPNVRKLDLSRQDFSLVEAMGLPAPVDILLASQMAYCPFIKGGEKGLGQLVDNAIKALSRQGMAAFVHMMPASPLARLQDVYGRFPEYEATLALCDIFRKKNLKVFTLAFPSTIRFPRLTDEQWENLAQTNPHAVGEESYQGLSGVDYEARAMAEFIIHRRLEDLAREGRLRAYLGELRALFEKRDAIPKSFQDLGTTAPNLIELGAARSEGPIYKNIGGNFPQSFACEGYIEVNNEMAVVVSPQADRMFVQAVRKAVKESKKEIGDATPLEMHGEKCL